MTAADPKTPVRTHASHDEKGSVVLRWSLPSLSLVLFGPLLALPVAGLADPTGGDDATLLLSDSPITGLVSLVLIAVVAAVGGAFTARVTAPGTGRTFAGLCVAWAAMRSADSWRLFEIHGGGAVIPLAIEGLIVAGVTGLVVAALSIGGGFHTKKAFLEDVRVAAGSANAAIGILIGVAAGVMGTVLVAIDGGRGQCLAGGFFGATLAAVAAQLATPTLTPEQARLRGTASVLVLMVVSPLVLLVMPGSGAIADAARAGTLTGPGIVQPLDWMVGVFLGVPTGMAWVGSVSERANQPAGGRAARPATR
jgi:hypothetical protein